MDNQLLKNLIVLNYKFFKNRLSTPLSTLRNSWYWRSLSLPGAPWRSLALPGASWRSVSLPGAPWRSLALLGAPWRFLVLPGAPWRSLALPDTPWRSVAFHGAATGPAGLSELRHSNEYLHCSNQCMREGQGVEPRKREYRLMCMCIYMCVCTICVSWPRLTSCLILHEALDGKNKRHS